jgi:Single Cache domain 2
LTRHDPDSEILLKDEPSEETNMRRNLVIGALASVAIALAGVALAQAKFGTAEEAKAMLMKAVAAVKADKAKAIDMFIKGEGGFKDRDLYPFCANNSDGKILATQAKTLIGTDGRTLKDKSGRAFGQEVYDAGQKAEGTISEVSYMFPRPGETEPVQKVSFVTKVGDIYCGVGYYK